MLTCMSMVIIMLSRVEHDQSFITLGPGHVCHGLDKAAHFSFSYHGRPKITIYFKHYKRIKLIERPELLEKYF